MGGRPFKFIYMRQLMMISLVLCLLTPACTSRSRVGTQGNTGDGGVESTDEKYGDTVKAAQAARDRAMRDSARHPDTSSSHKSPIPH
jgi:hypothetical protein